MYSFWVIFQTIYHVKNNFSVSVYTIIHIWYMVVYSMYSFRSCKIFLMRIKIPISKPYILYTTIHRISFNEEAKAMVCFLLWDNNIPRFSFSRKKTMANNMFSFYPIMITHIIFSQNFLPVSVATTIFRCVNQNNRKKMNKNAMELEQCIAPTNGI